MRVKTGRGGRGTGGAALDCRKDPHLPPPPPEKRHKDIPDMSHTVGRHLKHPRTRRTTSTKATAMRSRSARDTAANACSRQLGNRRDQCPSLRTPTRRNCIVLTAAGRRHPLVSGRWGVERNLVRPLGLNRHGLNKDLVLGLLMPRRRQEPGTDFPERDFLPFSLLFSNVRVNRISSRPAGQRTGLPSWLPFGTSFF